MSPYATLGLDEGESDERAIKRAYARLIKLHRPDQDPEGFARIHQAYQWLLTCRSIGAGIAALAVSPDETQPVPVVERESKTDSAWELVCDQVQAADRESAGDQREIAVTSAIAAMADVLQRGGGDWQRAHDLILPLVNDQPRRWGDVPEGVIARLLEDEPTCLEARALYLLKTQCSGQAGALLAAWTEWCEHGGGIRASAVPVVERMMRWCVFLDFPLASRIAALMERHSGLALSRSDLALAAGHAAKTFPPDTLPVLVALFSGATRTQPALARLVGDFVKKLGRTHPVNRMMAVHAPSMLRDRARRGKAASEGGFEPILRVLLTMVLVATYVVCQGAFGGPPLLVFLIGAFVLSLLYQGISYLVRNRDS